MAELVDVEQCWYGVVKVAGQQDMLKFMVIASERLNLLSIRWNPGELMMVVAHMDEAVVHAQVQLLAMAGMVFHQKADVNVLQGVTKLVEMGVYARGDATAP